MLTGHAIASSLNLGIFSPLGLSIVAISVAIWQSRLFRLWLCLLGVLSGAVLCVTGVIGGAGFQSGGQLYQVGNALRFGVLGFWVWMLVAGVNFFRAAGRARQAARAT